MQFEGVVWWSFRAMDESFGSVVDGSKGLREISGSCSKYVLSCKSRIVVEETAVSRHNFHQKLERIEEGIDKILKSCRKKEEEKGDDHFEGIGLLDRFEGIGPP